MKKYMESISLFSYAPCVYEELNVAVDMHNKCVFSVDTGKSVTRD